MADVHSRAKRSFNMSRIKSRHTKPERLVRSLAHSLGYRFRLHSKFLPGQPDLVFAGKRKVIFVNGCFFHMHRCKYGRVTPLTNATFWRTKREGNVARDRKNSMLLRASGWQVLTVWECWTKRNRTKQLETRLRDFLQ